MVGSSRKRFPSVFSRVLRERRLEQELSQEALSELAEVDGTYVGLLERGKRAPGLDVAKKIAAALEVPLADLIAEAEREWERGQPVRPRRRARGTRGRAR